MVGEKKRSVKESRERDIHIFEKNNFSNLWTYMTEERQVR